MRCMIVNPPFSIPEAPKPEIARAMISISEETAAPHNAEPSSKVAKKHKSVHCLR